MLEQRPTGIRNRALITVVHRGGLRLGEALALKANDVDADQGTITVLHGKGDRRRTVGFEKRVHPHGLRHTMAFELMMEGVPMRLPLPLQQPLFRLSWEAYSSN